MKTTQLISALGLAIALATVGGSVAHAEENINNQLQAAISQAENAQKVAQENPSTTYPGLDKYLDKKIAQAKEMSVKGTGDAVAMTQVLNEASEAAYLLSGTKSVETKATDTVAPAAASRSRNSTSVVVLAENEIVVDEKVQAVEVVERKENVQVTTPVVTLANTTVSVTVGEKPQSDVETNENKVEKTEEEQIGEEIVESTLDAEDIKDVEVPNTGEEKAGVVELIIAGIAVVLLTVGATVVIVKGKRNA